MYFELLERQLVGEMNRRDEFDEKVQYQGETDAGGVIKTKLSTTKVVLTSSPLAAYL